MFCDLSNWDNFIKWKGWKYFPWPTLLVYSFWNLYFIFREAHDSILYFEIEDDGGIKKEPIW